MVSKYPNPAIFGELEALGYTAGTYNDRLFKYLGDQSYIGSLTDRIALFNASTSSSSLLSVSASNLCMCEGDSFNAQVDGRSMASRLSEASLGLLNFIPNTAAKPGTEAVSGSKIADRLAVVSTTIAAHPGLTHVFINLGTNDISPTSLSTMESGATSLIDAYNAAGVYVIWNTITWRGDAIGLDSNNEAKRVAFNSWLKAVTGKNLLVVDMETTIVPTTGATYLQSDVLHPLALGAKLMAETVVSKLSIAGDFTTRLPTNAVTNPTFSGTSGTVQTGFTGGSVAPTSWTVDNDTGATVTSSVVDVGGTRTVQFDVSGSATTNAASLRLYRNETAIPLLVGEYADGKFDVEITGLDGTGSPTGLTGWQSACGDGFNSKSDHSYSTLGPMSWAISKRALRVLPVKETVDSTFQTLVFQVRFAVGVVSARIRISSPHFGKVV